MKKLLVLILLIPALAGAASLSVKVLKIDKGVKTVTLLLPMHYTELKTRYQSNMSLKKGEFYQAKFRKTPGENSYSIVVGKNKVRLTVISVSFYVTRYLIQ